MNTVRNWFKRAVVFSLSAGMLSFPANGRESFSELVRSRQYEIAEETPRSGLKRFEIVPSLSGWQMGVDEIRSVLGRRLKPELRKKAGSLATHIYELCRQYGFHPAEILALVEVESSFDPKAHSFAGARGLLQLLPRTAAYIARKRRITFKRLDDLYNPWTNLSLGVAYLSYLRERFPNADHYLAAYNMGPTSVSRMIRMRNFKLGALERYVFNIKFRANDIRVSNTSDRS